MDIKLISVTSSEEYERQVSEALTRGYKPTGELRVEQFNENYMGGDNCWHQRRVFRYIRELIRDRDS